MQRIPNVKVITINDRERVWHVRQGEEVIIDCGTVEVALRRGMKDKLLKTDIMLRANEITVLQWEKD